ncbi:type II secretion system protein [Candidatus Sumerlaeota bacterium]|nr:type II secretion system protein [Candidatus Sumerlaeota bacterium]
MINFKFRFGKGKGFTILESLVALVILTFMGISIILTMIYSQHYVEIENQRAKALMLASSEMERLKRTMFSSIVGYSQTVVIDNNGTAATNDDLSGALQVTVKDKNGTVLTGPPMTNDRVIVEIVVSWHPAGNPSGKLLSERLISEIAP